MKNDNNTIALLRKKYDKGLPINFETRSEAATVMFNDLNRFLNYFRLGNITEGKKFLDLGSANNDFEDILVKNKIEHVLYNDYKVDFETDKLPFKDKSFDFILFKAVIEHLHSADNVLREIKRILNEDGVVMITTPNHDYQVKQFWNDPTHKHPYNPISLKKILDYHGFKSVLVRPFLFRKASFYWKWPFWFAAFLPFKNHTFKGLPIPKLLRGNSTVMLAVGKKETDLSNELKQE